ncbi:MAG: GH3 auxin-responsive promoter family protein [Bacteroidota bacterium]
MSLINSIASWYLKKRVMQIEMFVKHPVDTQLEVFHKLIRTAEKTAWGEEFGFKDMKTIQQFQERVPISNYEQLFPYIERTLQGEKSVLWPGKIKWFSKSSGTTNDKSKFIPVTKESLNDCHFKGGKDMLAIYLHNRPDSQLFTGRALPIGGSHEINKLNSDSYYGDLSAVLIQNTPHVFNLFRATSKKLALMPEWESKIQAMAERVLNMNITSIAGVPTWTIVLINKLFEMAGTERDLHEIWPSLEVFFHGGVSFKPYRRQFQSLIPSDRMHYFETYNASEGFFGLQNERDKDDLLLMLDYGILYEFVKLEDLDQDHPRAYTISEVEPGVTYAMLITTNGGLWRYMIGDTVQFTSVSPFKIKIAGRTKHFINAFGEELMVDNAETALDHACAETGAVIANYTAAPIYFSEGQNGAHEWLVEFEKAPVVVNEFRDILDAKLRELNSDYDAKRYKSIALREPVLHALPKGTFYDWMKSRGKLGGQNKVPRLSNTRDYVDAILEMLKVPMV